MKRQHRRGATLFVGMGSYGAFRHPVGPADRITYHGKPGRQKIRIQPLAARRITGRPLLQNGRKPR